MSGNAKISNRNIEAVILVILAFGAYNAWTYSTIITSFVVQSPHEVGSQFFWLFSGIGHIIGLLLGFMLSRREILERHGKEAIWSGFIFLLTGTLLMFFESIALPVRYIGSCLTGFGNALIILVIAELLTRIKSRSTVFAVVLASMFLGFVIQIFLNIFPEIVSDICSMILPIITTLCVLRALKLDSHPKLFAENVKSNLAPLTPYFLIFCLVFSSPANFFKVELGSDWLLVCTGATILSSAVLVFILYRFIRFSNSNATQYLMVICVILLFVSGLSFYALDIPNSTAISGMILFAGQFIFQVFFYYQFFALSSEHNTKASQVFAVGLIVIDLGIVLSSLLGFFLQRFPAIYSSAAMSLIVLIAFLFTLVPFVRSRQSFFRIEKRDIPLSSLTTRPSSSDEKAPDSLKVVVWNGCLELGEEWCFTKREIEVCYNLVCGLSVQSIAEAMKVSQNTIKTHIRHIYDKTGAHSREDLLKLLFEL